MDIEKRQQPEDEIWDQIIAAGSTVEAFFPAHTTDSGIPVEMPSITTRRNRSFIPQFSERTFCTLKALGGSVWAVYLILWRQCHLSHSVTVTLPSASLRRFGITRNEKTTGLRALEKAGLVTVQRQNGKNPTVTLCVETVPWRTSATK